MGDRKPNKKPADLPELSELRLTDGRSRMGAGVQIKANGVTYVTEKAVGNGSFGVVYQATTLGTGEVVAIKKVLQDRRFKNRELQIMRMLTHPNVVAMRNSFYTSGADGVAPGSSPSSQQDVYLNLVLEFVPETVYRVVRFYRKMKKSVPMIYVKLYIYQLARALAYIHSLSICHRDIKPQNLLLDPNTGMLKLCDFGSAKVLVRGEPNVSYICSRYYRAPELIFGATDYSAAIDVWSMGCVMAELILLQPLFPGGSGVDQIVEIIKVLGTPTRQQLLAMNRNCAEFNFPNIEPSPLSRLFRQAPPAEALDVLQRMLVYEPQRRIRPLEVCAHPFFDELRVQGTVLPNGNPLPTCLFEFTAGELEGYEGLESTLIPAWAQRGDAKK